MPTSRSEYTPTTKRVRDLFSWAYAWRSTDYPEDGDTDLSGLREMQQAEFDRWLEAHDAEVRAQALASVDVHDVELLRAEKAALAAVIEQIRQASATDEFWDAAGPNLDRMLEETEPTRKQSQSQSQS